MKLEGHNKLSKKNSNSILGDCILKTFFSIILEKTRCSMKVLNKVDILKS